jgi:hypothetical protein
MGIASISRYLMSCLECEAMNTIARNHVSIRVFIFFPSKRLFLNLSYETRVELIAR